MNKLRSGQLFAMLLLSSAFGALCQTTALTMEGLFGAAIAAAVQILLCLPMLHLYAHGFSFTQYAKTHRLLPLLFAAYCLIRGGVSFVRLQGTTEELSLPFQGKFWAAALIALVCLYTASLGIHALARSSTLIFGILLFTLAVLLLGAIPQAEPQNLSMSPDDTIWRGFLRSMQHADEIVLLFLLLDAVRENYLRSTVQLIVGRFCLTAFLTLLGMSVLGSRMAQAQHPFFAITAISQPFSTQRADALYLLVYVMLCVLRITLYTALAAHLLHQQFPKLRYVSTICLLIMLAISWAVGIVPISGMWNLLALGVFVLLIPIGFLVVRKKGGTAL